jgi:hypothetical protein
MEHSATEDVATNVKKRYRFGYKGILLSVLIVCVCGWTGLRVARARVQAQMVIAIESIANCQVVYDGEDFFVERQQATSELRTESWPEALLGKDLFHRVGTVRLPVDRVEESLPYMTRLPYLRMVHVMKNNSSDKEKDLAIRRIRDEVPGVEDILVAISLGDS